MNALQIQISRWYYTDSKGKEIIKSDRKIFVININIKIPLKKLLVMEASNL